MNQSSNLPADPSVNVNALMRLFDNTTNSYKYLFFLSLLERLRISKFSEDYEFDIRDLIIDMLVLAWYPHVFFKLSFGKSDKTTRELDSISVLSLESADFHPWETQKLRAIIAERFPKSDLDRFVPFRLIRPFFAEVRIETDSQVNRIVAEMAARYFVTTKPLYRFDEPQKRIVMHPDWVQYLSQNMYIVKGWACWHYLSYMQKNNPMVPSLATKLFPPAERESLSRQTAFWNLVLDNTELACIYSARTLSRGAFCLDHFLPWSFVVHNELWNLVPVTAQANSSKSDRLPDDSYLGPFITVQHQALKKSHAILPQSQWSECVREHQLALKLDSQESLLDASRLATAYGDILRPQLSLARINGFQDGWKFLSDSRR